MRQYDSSLYFVTDESFSMNRKTIVTAEAALKGGANIIQLREKDCSADRRREIGKELKKLCAKYNALFIVNDSPELAYELEADGVHIGQHDGSIIRARALLGPHAVIGVSAATPEEALSAQQNGADYIGAGPVFDTASKNDAGDGIGLHQLKKIADAVLIPVIAIGGISLSNAESVIRCGVSGIAVISAIASSKDPQTSARDLKKILMQLGGKKMAGKILQKVRDMKPLVHHITNYVTASECANITLSAGALPVIACADEEAADIASCASALVLNIGTLNDRQVASMLKAGAAANEIGIPVILDPVGIGATPFRRKSVEKILSSVHVNVIKGNAAEISVLAGAEAIMRGVESVGDYTDISDSAKLCAQRYNCTTVVTGKRDIITDGIRILSVENGSEMMSRVVGTGCMSASVIAAFCAVESDTVEASAAALAIYGLAAEKASSYSSRPQLFKFALMDELQNLSQDDFTGIRILR